MKKVAHISNFLLVALVLTALSTGCRNTPFPMGQNKLVYFCDAERTEGNMFICGESKFESSTQQSSDFAKSGSFSCVSSKGNAMAFMKRFKNVKKGEYFEVRVWTKNAVDGSKGSIVIADDSGQQYDASRNLLKTEGDWLLISNTFIAQNDYKSLKTYCLTPNDSKVYFDDITVVRMKSALKPPLTDSTLRIFIPEYDFSRLDSFLVQGRKEDMLRKRYKKYVNGFILKLNDSIPIKLRLKGDWTDHLRSDKYSLRIKVTGDHAYDGLRTFSIQNPETRNMALEWYLHQICAEEDILTTRYEFINVEINGEIKGVYALEEHFDKQLLESRNRREGPIVKLDEDGLWQLNYHWKNDSNLVLAPDFLASSMLPFKKNRTYKNEVLRNNFFVAQSHLHKYKHSEIDSKDFLNLEDFAKYIAISDLANVHHSLTWHNQRQYYNPVTAKLEPVLYDAFQESKNLSKRRLFYLVLEDLNNCRPTNLNLALLKEDAFRTDYLAHTKRIGNLDYVEKLNQKLTNKTKAISNLLAYEYPLYDISNQLEWFSNNAKNIERNIDSLSTYLHDFESLKFELDKFPLFPEKSEYFFPDIALKAHTERKDSLTKTVSLRNYHLRDISVLAYSTDSLPDNLILLENKVKLDHFNYADLSKTITLPANAKYLHYAPENLGGQIVRERVSKWPFTKDIDVTGERAAMPKLVKADNYYTLPKGDYVFNQNVVIENINKLIIEAGTSIDLKNSAGFISYVPLELHGTAEDPIHIFSSDSSACGFNIITSKGHSDLSHVNFNQLNSMNKNHWILTGAVTIYGGSVDINNCTFSNNLSEDGLNIIRSDFNVDQCTISNTFSDGFDADFCTGTLTNSFISNTLNDALDFSGSEISVDNCVIKNAGDKGISGGEKSYLKILNTEVTRAAIGLAAKDLSYIEVKDCTLSDCEFSYAAFRKKPEYGPATIHVFSSNENEAKGEMLIDLDSEIKINNSVSKGQIKLDIDTLYLQQNL